MAYDFNQMFRKRGVNGFPGGTGGIKPPQMPGQGVPPPGGKPGQQFLGPPVQAGPPGGGMGPAQGNGQEGGPGMPGGGPGHTPPMPPQQGGPGIGQARPGAGNIGGFTQNQGNVTGALGKSSVSSGQPTYYGDYRDYIPGGVYYIPGKDPNIDEAYKKQNPGWEPGMPPVGGGGNQMNPLPGQAGYPGQQPGQFYPPGQGPIQSPPSYPYPGGAQPTYGPTQVPGGGRMPTIGGGRWPNPGGPQSYMPYFNPAGGIKYDPNNPGIPGAYY